MIRETIVLEARVLLHNPASTVAQVAAALHFPDPSSFGKFSRISRHTRRSPTAGNVAYSPLFDQDCPHPGLSGSPADDQTAAMNTTSLKRWKMALLTWLCVYPLINLIFAALTPLIARWPMLLQTLLVSVILVPLMGIAMRFLQCRFQHWLQR